MIMENKSTDQMIIKIIQQFIGNDLNSEELMNFELTSDLIDSITFIKMVVSLEDEFDFEFDADKLLIEEFPTVRSLVEYVNQKRH